MASYAVLPLQPRYVPYGTCHEVSPSCPVEATTLGYAPNKGLNIFLAIAYGLCGLLTLFSGAWKRTWGFSIAVGAGCFLECAGYAARVALHANAWNTDAFEAQIVAIILSPTLLCVAVYLTLKHVCAALNPALSRIPPRVYPFVFVPADVSCLVVQAIGGGVAASAHENDVGRLQSGNRAIIAGIVLQVVVLAGFGIVSVEYLVRVRKWMRGGAAGTGSSSEALGVWNDARFKMFLYAVSGAYFGILIRCIYRIAEMAGGWGNPIMQDQPSFTVLESFAVLVACVLLTAFPPGVFFPQMSGRRREKQQNVAAADQAQASDSDAAREKKAERIPGE